jgi:adenylate cyclase, class 2
MSYEVELKYAVTDSARLREVCRSLGAVPTAVRCEVDTYLRHPARSFEETDEALRVRQRDCRVFVTYKGPKVDATTKTRVEIEIELLPGEHGVGGVLDLWRLLGFLPVREVRKRRELLEVPWQGRQVHLSLDQVDGLGDFVELELAAESAELEQYRQVIKSLAEKLGLRNSERKSYLELLLQKDATNADTPKNAEDWTE